MGSFRDGKLVNYLSQFKQVKMDGDHSRDTRLGVSYNNGFKNLRQTAKSRSQTRALDVGAVLKIEASDVCAVAHSIAASKAGDDFLGFVGCKKDFLRKI